MSPDLDAQLCKDFPNLYRDRRGDMVKTAMCWGFPGDGWYGIIRRLSEKLEAAILAMPEAERELCCASQVKEKFGYMSFYMNNSTDEMEKWITEAETESARTCENCGGPGKIQGSDWLRCICQECAVIDEVLRS